MATTTQNDNRAKFLELRSQGKSVADARNATYGPPPVVADATPTTPVTATSQINQDRLAQNQANRQANPVVPTQPVTATSQINQDRLANNQSKVQADIALGERPALGTSLTPQAGQTQAPAPIVNAPVDQNTGLSTPLAPAVQPTAPVATTPVTPTTPKVDATPGITQDSFQQAQAESEKIKAQNEAKLAENQQKAQLAEQSRQQGITEQNTALANNEGAILNTLKTGGIIPETVKTSPYYKNAQQIYNKLQQYSTYSTADIVTAMNQGSILPGTGLYNEMMKDPALKKKLTDAQVYRQANPAPLAEVTQNASNDILSNNPTLNSALQDGSISMDEYNSMTNNPAVIAKAQDVEAKTNKYNKLKAEYDAIEDETRAEYQDKGGSGAYIDSIIADRQKSKYKALQLASGEMETATGTLTDLKSQASTLFNTNLELYKEKQKTSEALALSQAQFDQKLAQQTQLTNDPTTAIGGVIKQFSDLGIVGDRDLAWHVAEQKRLGMTLPEYTKKMIEDFKAKPEYQQALAKKANEGVSFQTIGDKVYKVQNGQLIDTGISATKAPDAKTPDWKQDQSGNWYNANSTTSPGSQVSTGTKPTGNIVPVTAGNKTVRLDQVGATGFENAINQLKSAGLSIVVGEGARDQTSTIKTMADRYGIHFNASNPAETAQKLRKAGHQVADPGKSNHENGMAIDVYGSSKLDKVTPSQEKILNSNGWYSAGISGDSGHFEYRGSGTPTATGTIDIPAYQKYLNTGALPTGIKAGTAKANEWLQGYSQWKSTSNPLSDSVQKRVDSYSDDYSKNPNVVSAFKFAPLLRQYEGIKVSDLSSSQRQGIISDYAKALDPDSVVREGEYATVAKYSSSWGEKTLSEIKQAVSGNGTLSDEAAQKVIDAIKSRGKNYIEQEKNIRNQYVEKINRATGYKDGDTQLVYPDYSTQSSTTVDKWSAIGDILSKALAGKPKQ